MCPSDYSLLCCHSVSDTTSDLCDSHTAGNEETSKFVKVDKHKCIPINPDGIHIWHHSITKIERDGSLRLNIGPFNADHAA